MKSLGDMAWEQADDPSLHTAEIDVRIEEIEGILPDRSCIDYIAGIVRVGDGYGVTAFIEPAGPLIRIGDSIEGVLNWWEGVARTQPAPEVVNFQAAGWHLQGQQNCLPDDPALVWRGVLQYADRAG